MVHMELGQGLALRLPGNVVKDWTDRELLDNEDGSPKGRNSAAASPAQFLMGMGETTGPTSAVSVRQQKLAPTAWKESKHRPSLSRNIELGAWSPTERFHDSSAHVFFSPRAIRPRASSALRIATSSPKPPQNENSPGPKPAGHFKKRPSTANVAEEKPARTPDVVDLVQKAGKLSARSNQYMNRAVLSTYKETLKVPDGIGHNDSIYTSLSRAIERGPRSRLSSFAATDSDRPHTAPHFSNFLTPAPMATFPQNFEAHKGQRFFSLAGFGFHGGTPAGVSNMQGPWELPDEAKHRRIQTARSTRSSGDADRSTMSSVGKMSSHTKNTNDLHLLKLRHRVRIPPNTHLLQLHNMKAARLATKELHTAR